jgi:hypothetical protein
VQRAAHVARVGRLLGDLHEGRNAVCPRPTLPIADLEDEGDSGAF